MFHMEQIRAGEIPPFVYLCSGKKGRKKVHIYTKKYCI